MKEILLLEDNGLIWDAFKEREIESKDIKVHAAFQVSDAMDLFEMYRSTIQWLVIDLNVPCIGLTKKETDDSLNNLISGWIWLDRYVYPDYPEFKKRTIIFSAHIKELEEKYDIDAIMKAGVQIMQKAKYSPTDIIEKIIKAFKP